MLFHYCEAAACSLQNIEHNFTIDSPRGYQPKNNYNALELL